MKKLFSILLLATVCALSFACMGCQNQGANVSANKQHAEAWVTGSLPGYEMVGFNSATLDQDGDGYVTVDITVRKPNTTNLKLIQLSCPTAGKFLQIEKGQGCKFSQMPFNPDF